MPNWFNSTVRFGVGSLILALLPFSQEGAKMNITSWALVGIGMILVLWGVFKPEHRLTPREAADLLESRKKYLPQLKDNIINKTKRLEYVRDVASKITFDEFLRKFVLGSPSDPKNKEAGFWDIAKFYVIAGFKTSGAMYNNLYYEDLKRKDDILNPLETEYDLLVAQNKDKKLRKKLNEYWDVADKSNSRIIFERMMRNAKHPLSPSRKNLVNLVEKFYSRKIKPIPISNLMNRIDELLCGASDE